MLSDDQIRILLSMVICIPFSYLIPKLPSTLTRQIYSLVLATIIQYYIYGTEIIWVLLLHVFIYFLVLANPKKCGKNVTVVSLLLLSAYHIYRMIVDYGGWTMDISTIMMCNVNKYSFFAYSIEDGRANPEKLTKEQANEKLEKIPSFFRFFGYCQFLPCSAISTPFPYKYFEDYMQLKNQYSHIPSPWKMVGHDVGYSFILVLVYAVHMFFFPLSSLKDPALVTKGFWYIIWFSFFCVTSLRFKYYFAWKLSMGAIHASGVSYQEHQDKTSDFKLIQACNPITVETTVHVREKIANWNMTCQEWLRKCVYERSQFKNKTASQLLTFMVSAFWHGFYGGYYLSFFLWFAQVTVSQQIFRESKKEKSPWMRIFKSSGIVGQILLWLAANMVFTVSGVFFQVLSLAHSIKVLKSIYFIPFVSLFIVYIAFTYGATREKKEVVAKDAKVSASKEN